MRGNQRIGFLFVEVIGPRGYSYNRVYVVAEVSTIIEMDLTRLFFLNMHFISHVLLANLSLSLVLPILQVNFSIQTDQCVRTRPTHHHWEAHAHARHHG